MNKKNCPNKNKPFLFLFLNLASTVLQRACFLSFIKKVVISYFLFLSFSAAGFVSPGINPHCALPLYMAALQSGMLQGQARGSSVDAQREKLRTKMAWYAEQRDGYEKAIKKLRKPIDQAKKALSDHFGPGGDHVVDQIVDHIEREQSQEDGDENRCDDDERRAMDITYYFGDKSFYFAKLSSVVPPPFSFSLLHKIAQTSLSQIIPAANASGGGSGASVVASDCNTSGSCPSNHQCCPRGQCASSTSNCRTCSSNDHCGQKGYVCLNGTCSVSDDDDDDDDETKRGDGAGDGDGSSTGGGAQSKRCGTATCSNADMVCCSANPNQCYPSGTNCNQLDGGQSKRCGTATCSNADMVCCSANPNQCYPSGTNCNQLDGGQSKRCGTATCSNADMVCCSANPNQCYPSGTNCNQLDGGQSKRCGTATCSNADMVCCSANPNQCYPSGTNCNQLDNGNDGDEATSCDHWKRWRKCAEDDGDIDKEKLCGAPKNCHHSNEVIPLERKNSKNECIDPLNELEKLIKKKKEFQAEMKEMENAMGIAYGTLKQLNRAEIEGTASTTEATDCGPECRLRRMRELKEIIDPAPSSGQVLGNVIGTLGAAALGYYGIREANKLRDAQGLGAQPGYALGLVYPFIMKGLHGGGLFAGNSSSLACGPTMNTMGGNVFQQAFLAQQMQYQQRVHYMQQMQLMQAYYSSMPGGMMPGMGGMMPGMGGMMPGMGGMFPNIGAGINLGIPGMGGMMPGMGGMMPGMGGMFPNIGAGINIGIPGMGGMMPGMGGMMPGMGGMMGAGNMQAYIQYQQAMMAYQQTQMTNYMQRMQAVGELRSQIAQLNMQMYNIMYGGNMGGAVNVGAGGSTTGGTNVGGGGNTTTGGGTTTGGTTTGGTTTGGTTTGGTTTGGTTGGSDTLNTDQMDRDF